MILPLRAIISPIASPFLDQLCGDSLGCLHILCLLVGFFSGVVNGLGSESVFCLQCSSFHLVLDHILLFLSAIQTLHWVLSERRYLRWHVSISMIMH
jgi:hypothetical protein